MKKIVIALVCVAAAFVSCHKTPPNLSVDLSMSEDVLSASGGTVKVRVISDGEWRTSTDDGIAVNPSSGSGDASVTITVPANTTAGERDVNVRFYSARDASVNQSVTIHQRFPGVSVSMDEQTKEKIKNVPALGDTIKVKVASDGGWRTSADDGIAVTPSSGSEEDVDVTIIVSVNTSNENRDMEVKFSSALNTSVSETVTIHQESMSLSVSPKEKDVAASGGTVVFAVTTDGEWKTFAESGAEVSPSSGPGSNNQVEVTVPANTTTQPRDIKVSFYSTQNPSLSQTVTIHQESISISVTPSSQQSVSASGGTVSFDVTADGAWKASADVSGTTITPSEWSILGKKQADVTVPANTTGETREVTVKFWLKDNADIFQTVTISQDLISISVSPKEVNDVPASGSEVKVNLISNGEWETSIGDWTDSGGHKIIADKVTLSTSSGSSWSGEVTVTVPANTTDQERRAKVTFRSKLKTSISQTVTIHQKPLSISVTGPTDSVPAAGGTVDVTVTSDGDWIASSRRNGGIPSPSLGSSGESVTITVPTNNTVSERDVKVRFYLTKHSTVSDTVIIHQKAPSISVSGLPDSVPAEGGEVNVKVTSDGGWGTRNLYSGATVSSSSHQGSGNDVPVTINVPKNTGEERDIKVIEFYSLLNANIKQAVTIHQKALEMSVTPQDATVSASGGTVDVTVRYDPVWQTSVKWTDSDDKEITVGDKFSVSPHTSSGEKQVTVTVPANTSGKDRYMLVRFFNPKTPSANKVVTIRQKASK